MYKFLKIDYLNEDQEAAEDFWSWSFEEKSKVIHSTLQFITVIEIMQNKNNLLLNLWHDHTATTVYLSLYIGVLIISLLYIIILSLRMCGARQPIITAIYYVHACTSAYTCDNTIETIQLQKKK